MSPRKARALFWTALSAALAITAGIVAVWPVKPKYTYQGKTPAEWFASDSKDWFAYGRPARQKKTDAFKAMGTNAVPFLSANLRRKGNGKWYFYLYRHAPKYIQSRLPHPMTGDDIRMITLETVHSMQPLPDNFLASITAQVPGFTSPALRLNAIYNLTYQPWGKREKAILELSSKLLDDPALAVRLAAAMKLSEANQYDARIAPMLTAALQDEQLLTSNLAYFVYTYGIPTSRGLGSPTSPLPAKKTFWDEQLQMRQLEIANALKQAGQVGAKLNEEQRALIEHYSAQVRR